MSCFPFTCYLQLFSHAGLTVAQPHSFTQKQRKPTPIQEPTVSINKVAFFTSHHIYLMCCLLCTNFMSSLVHFIRNPAHMKELLWGLAKHSFAAAVGLLSLNTITARPSLVALVQHSKQ